tara:strand:- start:1221 stop:1877 length:657 start_codon:yes stop_codon:yes gene_type:complete
MGGASGSPVVQLARGASQIGLELSQASCEQLLDYAALLRRWNQVHNLTTIDEASRMLTHHLLDSLSIAPFVSGDRCIDIGSGAGLPGMVLALAQPEQQWTLVESRVKKASFLREAKTRCNAKNVTVVAARIEDYRPPTNFDTLASRAVSTLADLFKMTVHLHHPQMRLITMKGVYPQDELNALTPSQQNMTQVFPVEVPGLGARRHIVVMAEDSENQS